jgi:hypothetical protein
VKPISDRQVSRWKKAIRESYRALGEELPESDITKLVRTAIEAAIIAQLDTEVAMALEAPSKPPKDDDV